MGYFVINFYNLIQCDSIKKSIDKKMIFYLIMNYEEK